ncbi:hypothetical protein FRC11_003248, partial [Ceratobasidium sp. 423]
ASREVEGNHSPSREPTGTTAHPVTHDMGSQSSLDPSIFPSSRPPSPRSQINNQELMLGPPNSNAGHNSASDSQEQHSRNVNSNLSPDHTAETRNSKLKGLEKLMHALHLTAEVIPPVKSAVGGLVSCLDQFQITDKNREEYDEVASELSNIAEYLDQHLKDPRSRGLTGRISDIA